MILTILSISAVVAGSIWIDEAFEEKFKDQLNNIQQEYPELQFPERIAHRTAKGIRGQTIKLTYGTPAGLPSWSIMAEGFKMNEGPRVTLSR